MSSDVTFYQARDFTIDLRRRISLTWQPGKEEKRFSSTQARKKGFENRSANEETRSANDQGGGDSL